MKKVFILPFILLVFISFTNNSVGKELDPTSQNKLSPFTKMLLYYLDKETSYTNRNTIDTKDKENKLESVSKRVNLDSTFFAEFSKKYRHFQFININGKVYVGVILLTDGSNQTEFLNNIGALVGFESKDILSIKIQAQDIDKLLNNNSIKYVQVDEKVGLLLDKVKQETGFNLLHDGTYLGKEVDGNGVIVGVIDVGFDFTHSHFLKNNSTTSRISRAWIQSANNGASPVGFSYGSEYIGTTLEQRKTDLSYETHGTHVTGIAAGSGYFNDNIFTGLAPKSEVVLVSPNFDNSQSITTGQTNILDGIKYLYRYADLVKKPLVVNMSLGTTLGPRDGTALFDRACDNIQQRGKILVTAAGNSGASQMHLSQNFDLNKLPLKTKAVAFQTTQQGKSTYIDVWGEKGKTIEVEIGVNMYGVDYWGNAKYNSNISGIKEVRLSNSSGSTNYGKAIISTSNAEFNGKPRILIAFDEINLQAFPILRFTENCTGTLHAWNAGLGGSTGADFSNGNTDYTLLEIGGAGKSLISVGSYTTKNSTVNLKGNTIKSVMPITNGNLSPFSSIGPTVDGRIKPDITAPGSLITSSFNSNNSSYSPSGSQSAAVVARASSSFSSKDYYGVMEGTSMACPVVSGTVAMMLEVYPNLSFDEASEIIKTTALNDVYTGIIKQQGSPEWGYGKINVKEVVEKSAELGRFFGNFPKISLYPNPTAEEFSAKFTDSTAGSFTFTTYDLLGAVVESKKVEVTADNFSEVLKFSLKERAKGSYIFTVSNDRLSKTYLVQKSF